MLHRPQSWKGDFLGSRKDPKRAEAQGNLDLGTDVGDRDEFLQNPLQSLQAPPERKPSAVAKIYRRIVNPNKSQEMSEGSAYFNPEKVLSSLQPIGHSDYVGEFK